MDITGMLNSSYRNKNPSPPVIKMNGSAFEASPFAREGLWESQVELKQTQD